MAIRFQLILILAPFLSMWSTLSVPLSEKFGEFTTGTKVVIIIPERETSPLTTIFPTKETDPSKFDKKEEPLLKPEDLSQLNLRTLSNDENVTKESTVNQPTTTLYNKSTEDEEPTQELSVQKESDDEELAKGSINGISEKKPNDTHLSDCPTECLSEEINNICSSIGKVYESECHMKKENCGKDVYQVHWENCRGKHPLCPDNCLLIYDPVCSHDGRVYTNLCVLHSSNCGQTIILHDMQFCLSKAREFRDVEACPRQCQEIYEPACGSDGQVYMNECFLRLYNCAKNVEVVDMEKCVDAPECPSTCTSIYDPVCGSDGKIYLNYCRFIRDNCGKDVEKRPRSFCEEKLLSNQKDEE